MYEYNLGIRFESIAERYPEKTALRFSQEESVNYADLNRLANRLAGWLLEKGVAEHDVICISGTKTLYTFGCILACLKIGATYTVFDPDSPSERLRKILTVCEPKLLLAEHDVLAGLSDGIAGLGIDAASLNQDELLIALEKYDDVNLKQTRAVTGTYPAYIMYTSGSTGLPKGAVITHANVLNLISWSVETFTITPDDILTNVNALYFDNSVFDFYAAIFTGACLVTFSKAEVRDPKQLVEKINATGCSLWFSVPSLLIFLQTMKATDGKNLRSIRRFVFGGEGYPKAKLKALYDVYSDTAELFNVYGPTECTCICSAYKLSAKDFEDMQGLPPLGYIADNFGYLILDDEDKTVSPGESGQLCLLGPNVGRGYYNDPDRTAAAFVPNPYNTRIVEIMYKTGDMVRVNPVDGKLHIQGRKDNQIKHMGYRVELEEIESAMHCLDYVSEAAALHSNSNGHSRIIAIVASRRDFAEDEIRSDLKRMIPDYMIPSVFHREQILPKNPNGKVDRRNLSEKYSLKKEMGKRTGYE